MRVIVSGDKEAEVVSQIDKLAVHLRRQPLNAGIVGPASCVLERLQGKYRYHILAKCQAVQPVVEAVSAYLGELSKLGKCGNVSFAIDAEPQNMT